MKSSNLGSQSQASQHACSSLCDEVVILWRLAALNPGLSSEERQLLREQFSEWHVKVIDKVTKTRGITTHGQVGQGPGTPRRTSQSFKAEIEVFTGFKPAIEACYLSWDDYPVPGVTYTQGHRLYHCPFTCFRHSESHGRSDIGQINASSAVLKNDIPVLMMQRRVAQVQEYGLVLEELRNENARRSGFPLASPSREDRAGNRSSVSSEGFCENEGETFDSGSGGVALSRDFTRQDSDDPVGVCGSDTNEVLHAGGADSCNSTDKENKSSPEDFDADSDWSTGMEGGATAAAAAAAATTSTCTSTTAATAVASAVVVTRRKQVAPE